MPDPVTVAGELQQCLEVCNRNMRSAGELTARALTLVHEAVTNSLLKELRSSRVPILRATEMEEDEVLQRINSLKERQRGSVIHILPSRA